MRDIKRYYPDLITGQLKGQRLKRFFKCLSDTSRNLFVDPKFFTHDPGRDYYSKSDITRLFSLYLGFRPPDYPPEFAEDLTNKFFTIKTILIGGSINELKDTELEVFTRLIPHYKKIYDDIRKVIPVLKKAFSNTGESITPEEVEWALNPLWSALDTLRWVYQREKIEYPIHYLQKYPIYLKKANLISSHTERKVKYGFRFIHHVFGGLFPGQQNISENDWDYAVRALYRITDLFLFYKAQFSESLSRDGTVFRLLRGMERLIHILQIRADINKGFPVNNLDGILTSLLSFIPQNSNHSDLSTNFFSQSISPIAVSLFTRTLNCFSLDQSSHKSCKSKWGNGGSEPIVSLSFSDTKFEIFSNKINKTQITHTPLMMSAANIDFIQKWLEQYIEDMLNIYDGYTALVASNRQFDHWLNDSLFGWEATYSRLTFAPFDPFTHPRKTYLLEDRSQQETIDRIIHLRKPYQLLHYQAFLPLIFRSYVSDRFFSSKQGSNSSISFKTWQDMIRELSPALMAVRGYIGYQHSWRASFTELFEFSDFFLYSSNRDQHLNSRELVDGAIHLMEGLKNNHLAYDKIYRKCHNLQVSCAVEILLSDPDILAAYPKMKQYIESPFHKDEYRKQITSILEYEGATVESLSFISLFMVMQMIELNRERIDQDQFFSVDSDEFPIDSDELRPFIEKYEEELAMTIPYLSSSNNQANAFLMYSFKTGHIPFFTERPSFVAIDFTDWYFEDGHREEYFQISDANFHLVILNFYDIYIRI